MSNRVRFRVRLWLAGLSAILVTAVQAAPLSLDDQLAAMEAQLRQPGVAPTCTDPKRHIVFPSKVHADGTCDDGDMTLFNGLLCSVSIDEGCSGLLNAQIDDTGEWLRSPRYVSDRNLHPKDSFSPDMALGVQVASVKKNAAPYPTRVKLWLDWIEANRPCEVGNEPNCAVRGWPRFCRDDSEKGCTLRPGDIGQLAQTVTFLKLAAPPTLDYLFKQAGGADRRDQFLYVDSNVNDLGFSLHLTGVGIYIARLQGDNSPLIQAAADKLAERQPKNPFFLYLSKGPTDAVKQRVLDTCPVTAAGVNPERDQWTWERADNAGAAQHSMVWECLFMARLLKRPN